MNTPLNIMIPLDGAERAEQAIPLATTLVDGSGRITLLQIESWPVLSEDSGTSSIATGSSHDDAALEQHRTYLNSVADALRPKLAEHVDISRHVVVGEPVEEILRASAEERIDAVVMASHGRGAFGRSLHGSVSDEVARKSTVPVIIVRPTEQSTGADFATVRRLIVPLDRSELALNALPVAKNLAKRTGAEIHIVHIMDNFSTYMAVSGVPVTQPVMDEWYADAEKEFAGITEGITAEGIKASYGIYQGQPARNLMEMAAPGDVVVMTSRGRSGFARWLLGSVAETLVRESTAPVCLVPVLPPADHEA